MATFAGCAERGQRYVHEQAELGPRDIVARAIRGQQRAGRRVYLDSRSAVGRNFPHRFPTVWGHCQRAGIDPRRQPIPVSPAAHYAMAGVAVDASGRSSLPGLWACGEVSSTGVHGANRLASNSLLEALVFGARVAEDLADAALGREHRPLVSEGLVWRDVGSDGDQARRTRQEIRRLMWEHVGLEREGAGLSAALEGLDDLADALPREPSETWNLWTVGRLVAAAALSREESRGSHYRTDFPQARESFRRRMFWTYQPATAGDFPLAAVGETAKLEIA